CVDDGSTDATPRILAEAASEHPDWLRLLPLRANGGKGAAVAAGFASARGEFLLFLDSDLAYAPDQTLKVLAALEDGADVAIACRVLDESRFVMSPNFFRYLYTRHLMGRFFNLLVRSLVVPGLLDTQAGLKGFRRPAAQRLFKLRTLDRFSFDVEILFIAQRLGLRISQVPVEFRYFHEDSTVRFVRDTVAMLADLARIRMNGARGRYEAPVEPVSASTGIGVRAGS
ncbi:MAG: glycosyltransferase, partial [Elusimicrobia bacterium]|nr:glycosyltransferase [Elusimicrobiota bacterium]